MWMLLNQVICSELAYTFGVPYELLWICMNKANSSEYAYTLVCTVHWVSVWSDSPGDDKGIFISLSYFLRPWAAGVLCPAGVHSISFNDLKICKFIFLLFCSFPFFFQALNLLSIPLLSILIVYSLLSFLLEISLSIIFLLIDLLQFIFSIHNTVCMSGNQLWEAACADKPMLPVTSDAHDILSTLFGMCSNHQVSLLTQIYPIIACTFCINGYFACDKFDGCSIACLHV